MTSLLNGLLSPDQFREQFAGLAQEIDDRAKAEQRRAEWLELKRGKFGASSASNLWTSTLKPANNKTSRDYIARKAAELDGVIVPEISGPSLRWGNEQEEPGMVEFIERTGLDVTNYGDSQEWVASDFSDQVGATKDGLTVNANGQVIPIEQKNPYSPGEHGRLLAMETGADLLKVKHEYYCQVQHQIMVLNAPFGIFFSRDCRRTNPAARMGWWIVERNNDFIEAHKARLLEAIAERDALYLAQQGREWVDLSQFLN